LLGKMPGAPSWLGRQKKQQQRQTGGESLTLLLFGWIAPADSFRGLRLNRKKLEEKFVRFYGTAKTQQALLGWRRPILISSVHYSC